jgi:glycine oxidase
MPGRQYVDPHRLTLALAAAAKQLGARVETAAPVKRFLRTGRRLRGVETPAAVYEADAVLLAGGPWTAALARRLGAYLPVKPMRGQMLSLKGPPRPLRSLIWGSAAYMVPRENGQTFVGSTVEDVGFRCRTTKKAVRALRLGAEGLVPALAYAEHLSDWAGLRPAAPDALPIMGELPGWSNVWVSTGHFRNGILLAPASGALVARSVLAGRAEATLSPFSPRRFME